MIMKAKKENGSVLVFTLFIVVLTLVTGISLMATSLSGRRSTLSSGKSVNAFQIADSGLEAALIAIKEANLTDTVDSVFNGSDCNSDGEVENLNISDGEYKITFWDDNDPAVKIDCDDNIQTIGDIAKVKSVGTYRNTTRSVETTFQPNP